jgi:hypothetical protein
MEFRAQEQCLLPGTVYANRRGQWKELTGKEAPTYNPAFQVAGFPKGAIKTWSLKSAAPIPVQMLVQPDLGKQPELMTVTMTPAELDAVNFPGDVTPGPRYPEWRAELKPVQGYVPIQFGPVSIPRLIDRSQDFLFATADEIEVLKKALAAGGMSPEVVPSNQEFVMLPGETRIAVDFIISGSRYSYGQLFEMQATPYVGAPGKWSVQNGKPNWTPAPPTPQPSVAVIIPPPVLQPAGSVPAVMQMWDERVLGFDLDGGPAPSGGGLLPDERAAILETHALVVKIAKLMNIGE